MNITYAEAHRIAAEINNFLMSRGVDMNHFFRDRSEGDNFEKLVDLIYEKDGKHWSDHFQDWNVKFAKRPL